MKTLLEIGARYPFHAKKLTRNGGYDYGVFVECDPYSIPTIFQTLESSGIPSNKYDVFCFALSGQKGITSFQRRKEFGHLTRHGDLSINNKHDLLQKMFVYSTTLDDLLEKLSLRPNLMRINVEGAEKEILDNYSWYYKPEYIEVDTHVENKAYCVNILREMGYKVVKSEAERMGHPREIMIKENVDVLYEQLDYDLPITVYNKKIVRTLNQEIKTGDLYFAGTYTTGPRLMRCKRIGTSLNERWGNQRIVYPRDPADGSPLV